MSLGNFRNFYLYTLWVFHLNIKINGHGIWTVLCKNPIYSVIMCTYPKSTDSSLKGIKCYCWEDLCTRVTFHLRCQNKKFIFFIRTTDTQNGRTTVNTSFFKLTVLHRVSQYFKIFLSIYFSLHYFLSDRIW